MPLCFSKRPVRRSLPLPRPPSGTDCGRFWEARNCAAKRTDAAIAHYRAAAEVAPIGPRTRPRLWGSERAQTCAGAYRDAKATFERALRETGCWPSNRIADLCRSIASWIVPMRIGREHTDPVLLRAMDIAFAASQQLAWVTTTRSLPDYTLHALRLLRLARSTRDPDQLALAYGRLVSSLGMNGFSGIGLWFAPTAKEYMESCRSPVQKAYAASQIANVYTFLGQRDRAIAIFKDAQAKLERYGHWYSPIVLHHTRRLYASNGDSQSELAIAIKEYAIAEQTGNTMGHAWGDFARPMPWPAWAESTKPSRASEPFKWPIRPTRFTHARLPCRFAVLPASGIALRGGNARLRGIDGIARCNGYPQ